MSLIADADAYLSAYASLLPFRTRPRSPVDPHISALADSNLAGCLSAPAAPTRERLADLNARFPHVFVLELAGDATRVWPKPAFTYPAQHARLYAWLERQSWLRLDCYRRLIARALARRSLGLRATLAIDVNDIGCEGEQLPLFCFQKRHGSWNILLPDVDFFTWRWYGRQIDRLAYERKAVRACFIGASTGGTVDVDAIANRSLPRLRSAASFVDDPRVEFKIASAAQCADEAAERMLRRQAYFAPRQGWREQRSNRFLLAMDGNGATCSRVAIALKSRCVLVRYASPYRLYYFDQLVAGRDYLEVEEDAGVRTILDREEAAPGLHRPIAEAGTRAFERLLLKPQVLDYTAMLLARYAERFGAV